jgi:CheY-like chemotaxis protein
MSFYLRRADGMPFSLILIDMQMPIMAGYSATRRLRSEGWTEPIVAVTAHAMDEDRQRCLEAGCTEYRAKPIDKSQLLELAARQLAVVQTPVATYEGG